MSAPKWKQLPGLQGCQIELGGIRLVMRFLPRAGSQHQWAFEFGGISASNYAVGLTQREAQPVALEWADRVASCVADDIAKARGEEVKP